MLEGQATVSPVGVEEGLRPIVPDSPERLVTVTVPLVDDPDEKDMEGGDIARLKSINVTANFAHMSRDPLVPSMYTL